MENKISNLQNYSIQYKSGSEPEERCHFYFLENDYLWKEFDVEGHHTLDEAFEIAKGIIVDDLIKMALKESIKSLDLKSKHFHFKKDGETEDLRDYIFDMDVLDVSSDLFMEYRKLLWDNFNEDMIWYFFKVDAMKYADIHDDSDKKTLYHHYFDGLEEFKSRQSFMEYSHTYNEDYEGSGNLRRIHYNFFIFGDYHCIDNSITRGDLRNFALSNGYYIPEDYLLSNLTVWELFGYYYGKTNGLSEFESISFALNLAVFFSNGFALNDIFKNPKKNEVVDVDKYFNESMIRQTIDQIIYRIIDGNLTGHTKEIFFTIFDLYKNNIQEFEKKTRRLEFRLSEKQYRQFMALKGKSKSDKLSLLLTFDKEEIEGSLLPDIDFDKDSIEEWKENNKPKGKVFFKDEWFSGFKPSLKDEYGEDKEIIIINTESGALSPEEQSIIRDIEFMNEQRAVVEEEEFKAFMEEEAEFARKEIEWMKIHEPEEYERQKELSEKLESLSPEEREEFLKEMFKGLRGKEN